MSDEMNHLTLEELEAGLDRIRQAPADDGALELIVRRPETLERETLDEAKLDIVEGLIGDSWIRRRSSMTEDGSPHPEMQLNLMNSRVIDLVARQQRERWRLAGDQLFVDLDLSLANLPAGTRLAIGEAVIEVTPVPHTGCKKFVERYGLEAMKWVNSPVGRELNLRGICAKVVQAGVIRTGRRLKKIDAHLA